MKKNKENKIKFYKIKKNMIHVTYTSGKTIQLFNSKENLDKVTKEMNETYNEVSYDAHRSIPFSKGSLLLKGALAIAAAATFIPTIGLPSLYFYIAIFLNVVAWSSIAVLTKIDIELLMEQGFVNKDNEKRAIVADNLDLFKLNQIRLNEVSKKMIMKTQTYNKESLVTVNNAVVSNRSKLIKVLEEMKKAAANGCEYEKSKKYLKLKR